MENINGVSTEWVKICPFLEVNPPHPLMADVDERARKVQDIYDFFKERNPNGPMEGFKEIYNRLPIIPEAGETKLSQVMRIVNLMKISRDAMGTRRKTQNALKKLGVK